MSPKGKRILKLKRARSFASSLGYPTQFWLLTAQINLVAKTWP